MRALSLWQPHAQLIALELKRIETRGWYTGHTGPLAIQASKHRDVNWERAAIAWILEAIAGDPPSEAKEIAQNALKQLSREIGDAPRGAVVCVVDAVACVELDTIDAGGKISVLERACGNYNAGRFGIITRNVRRLVTPLPWRGHQKLFHVDDAAIAPHLPRSAACRICGCTEHRACVVAGLPCHWIEPDLCSACAP